MRLLIVEDNGKHLEDAKAVVKHLQKAFDLEVRYEETLVGALSSLDWAGAVVTDLFYPIAPGGPAEPPTLGDGSEFAETYMSGIMLAKRCLKAKKPVVICTSTCHHGNRTQPACEWAREHEMELVDSDPEDETGVFQVNGEVTVKNWTTAILFAIITFEKTIRGVKEKAYRTDFLTIKGFVACRENGDHEGAGRRLEQASPTVAQGLRMYDCIPK